MYSRKIFQVFLSVAFIAYGFFFASKPLFAVTLFSSGFESGGTSLWSSSGGGATATTSADFVHGGSLSLLVQHDKTLSYGYQTVVSNLESGMFYELYGYGRTGNANLNTYFLRVAWYASSDGTGSQLSQVNDSNSNSSSDTDWVKLATSAIQAPSTANSAKIRLVITSKISGQIATAYFDDIVFQESIAPTNTPTPTPTNSPTATPTKTPTPLPTVKATATITQTISPTKIEAKITSSSAVLGAKTAKSTKIPTSTLAPSRNVKKIESTRPIFPQLFMGAGVLCLSGCGILGFRVYKKGKITRDV